MDASPATQPRIFRFQFSLRMLLFVFTGFAIGFPILYRWPYQETHVESQPGSTQSTTRTTTWQRQWGGGRVKHGVERLVLPDGKQFTLLFAAGRLTHIDGKPANNRLLTLALTGRMDELTATKIIQKTDVDFVFFPLKDVAFYLGERHAISVFVDRKVPAADMPITANIRGIDLASALMLLTEPNSLCCDYRYGGLWITPIDESSHWHDPTGMADIKPSSGSTLARVWNEPIALDCAVAPLVETLAYIERKMAVSIDTSRVQAISGRTPTPVMAARPSVPMTTPTIWGRPFRHVIGHLLYNHGCRCELDDDKLVILPPE